MRYSLSINITRDNSSQHKTHYLSQHSPLHSAASHASSRPRDKMLLRYNPQPNLLKVCNTLIKFSPMSSQPTKTKIRSKDAEKGLSTRTNQSGKPLGSLAKQYSHNFDGTKPLLKASSQYRFPFPTELVLDKNCKHVPMKTCALSCCIQNS